MVMTPREDQEEAIERIVSEPTGAALLALKVGSGKTLIATEVAKRSQVETVLIICPLNTRIGWERTFRAQGCKAPITRLESKNKEAREDLKKGVPGVYIIGREYFRMHHDWDKFRKIDLVVNDECHGYSNRASVGFKSVRKLKAKRKLSLSATPWGNKFENAWATTKWLWPDHIPRGFWNWVAQWGRQREEVIWKKNSRGIPEPQEVMKIEGEANPGSFVKSLPCYIRFDTPDHPVLRSQLFVELTPAQRKMYDKFEKDAFVWLDEHNAMVEDLPIVQRIRLNQLAMGTVKLDDDGQVYFPEDMKSAKLDALMEYLKGHDQENVLILTKWKPFANIIASKINKSDLGKAELWTGDTKLPEREDLTDRFGVDVQYIVATASSLEAGVDGLQHNCNTIIWMDRGNQNPTLHEQVEGRIARPTHDNELKEVLILDIVAVDTFDEQILDRDYLKKKAVRESLGDVT